MSVLHPRNRLVNFRLSEEEFDRLRAACERHGARSISDFARSSVLDRMESAPARRNVAQAEELDGKVAQLETRVEEILALLSATGQAVRPAMVDTFESEPVAVTVRGSL